MYMICRAIFGLLAEAPHSRSLFEPTHQAAVSREIGSMAIGLARDLAVVQCIVRLRAIQHGLRTCRARSLDDEASPAVDAGIHFQ